MGASTRQFGQLRPCHKCSRSGVGSFYRNGRFVLPVERGFSGLGAADAQTTTAFNSILSQLQQANASLQSLAAAYASNPSLFDSTFTAGLSAAQALYSQIVGMFTSAYEEVFGIAPPGLSGLGDVTSTITGAATTVAYAVAAALLGPISPLLYELNQYLSSLNTQAQAVLTKAQTQSSVAASAESLMTQGAAAYASGDSATGDSLTAEANSLLASAAGGTPPAPSSGPTTTELVIGGLVILGAVLLPKYL